MLFDEVVLDEALSLLEDELLFFEDFEEEDEEPDFDAESESESESLYEVLRESVLYQPEPLNEIAGTCSRRRAGSPHFSQGCVAGEPKGSCRS